MPYDSGSAHVTTAAALKGPFPPAQACFPEGKEYNPELNFMSVSSASTVSGSDRPSARREPAAANGHTSRREETRLRLIAAGTELFARRGLHQVTTAQIAREAGVATGTFYLHFADKHALFQELVFDALADLRSRQERAAASRAAGDSEVAARIEELVRFTEEQRDLIRVVFARGPESGRVTEEIHDRVARGLEARLAERVKAEGLPLHPGAAAQARAATLIRVIAWWAEDPTRASREEIVQTLLHLEPGRSAVKPRPQGSAPPID